MINLTPEQIVKEVDEEWLTGKHKYLWLAKDVIAKRFNINPMTLDANYYKAKKRKEFRVWIEQVNACVFDVKALNEDEAIIIARRIWKKENQTPDVGDVKLLQLQKSSASDKGKKS
jgi:hypothetical protein